LGGFWGGLVAFIWTGLSWTVLPWHTASLLKFTNESAIEQAIIANAPESGIYALPNPNQAEGSSTPGDSMLARMERGPNVFASVQLKGDSSMEKPMVIGLLIEVLGAALITWLLLKTAGLGYGGRVMFVVIASLAAWVLGELPSWNWWHFSTGYTFGGMIDRVMAGILSGLVIAKVTGRALGRA
jgi:hypothetical protein